ncbi:MAG TPA: radical SAM family heme chaperone HemW [Steroidobacteraceae bacterium]|nr:radical SAM family heme chaperone HemW [Steroidobacteraceae bacterium]
MTLLTSPPLALYLHFPWCVRKCPYCDFNSYTLHGELAEERYIDALERDLESQAAEVLGREVSSIFLGGGTPSLFSPDAIAKALAAARRHLTVAADAEVTMEANPGTLERGRFTEYRAAGLNRVSLGAQSFDAGRLERLGRIHSPDETRRAAEELHAAGLSNFNLDLMYALPEQDLAAAISDIEAALALEPAHLSHYQLTLEPGTVFAAERPALPDDDIAAEMLAACRDRLDAAGFTQYEVSAYSRPDRRCRHNLNYWNFGDYLGVGAGAHGKLTCARSGTITRTTHAREPRRYLAVSPAVPTRRAIAASEVVFEFMLNALRLTEGFGVELFERRTGLAWQSVLPKMRELERRGLVVLSEPPDAAAEGLAVRPTELGLRFLNETLLAFLEETPKTADAARLSTVS